MDCHGIHEKKNEQMIHHPSLSTPYFTCNLLFFIMSVNHLSVMSNDQIYDQITPLTGFIKSG